MINFQLNILPTRPDYVVLYHGYNDLHLYLSEGFAADYSHGRQTLAAQMPVIKRAHRWPKIGFWHSYECLKDTLFGTGNIRNDVLAMISSAPADTEREFHDLRVERDILENIVILCRHHGIRVVLSSYAYFNYAADAPSAKYASGVDQENENMRELAETHATLWVDQAAQIPFVEENFVDAIHFTPRGMDILAANFTQVLLADIADSPAIPLPTPRIDPAQRRASSDPRPARVTR